MRLSAVTHQLSVGPVKLDIECGPGVRHDGVTQALSNVSLGFLPPECGTQDLLNDLSVKMALTVAEAPFAGREATTRFQIDKTHRYASHSSFWDAYLVGFDGGAEVAAHIALSPLIGPSEFEELFRMLLRIVASSASVLERAIMLHGCAMVRPDGGSALLFLGPSGAGKTTMRTRLPGWRPLADDTVMVMKTEDRFLVCGTPFGGSEGYGRSGEWVPLERFVFLAKGSQELKLQPVGPELGFSEIVQRTMWFVDDGNLRERLLDLVIDLAQSLPLFRLDSSLEHTIQTCFDSGQLEGVSC